MLPLLQSVESISSCRDRGRLPAALLAAVDALFDGDAQAAICVRDAGDRARLAGSAQIDLSAAFWRGFLDGARRGSTLMQACTSGWHCGAIVLEPSELRGEELVLAVRLNRPLTDDLVAGVETLARIYGNQIRLLDYSELDSLTRLLNRKTFDETFDRLLTSGSVGACDGGSGVRRACDGGDCPAWLCVVDIDHFKRINDSFGHLFGDEVLLRMGDLMRKTFRDSDRLFRFGGEEFVVILNAPDEAQAAIGFDRFRETVEGHEFPQVGKVTCSIGFTGVSVNDVPTDVVGRADEALYFAKENGRNQVCCYEELVAQGLIAKSEPAGAKIADDFDIDALFG